MLNLNLHDAIALLRSVARRPPIEYIEGLRDPRCTMCRVAFDNLQDETKPEKHKTRCPWRLARELVYQQAPKAPPQAADDFDAFRAQVSAILDGLLEEFYNEGFRAIHRMTISRTAQTHETAKLKGILVTWRTVAQERLGVSIVLPFPYEAEGTTHHE